MASFEQIAFEMKAQRETRQRRLTGFLDAMQKPDVKSMRDLLTKLHSALPLAEGPVKDSFEKKPRIFFSSQEEFNLYTQDRPFYWNDERVKKAYGVLSKIDWQDKSTKTLLAVKNIFFHP